MPRRLDCLMAACRDAGCAFYRATWLVLACGAMAFVLADADAADRTWQQAAGGFWHDVQNWDGGVPATAADHAWFGEANPTGTAVITLDAPASLNRLTVTSPYEVALIGAELLTFSRDDSELPSIDRPVSGPQLSLDLPVEVADSLTVAVGNQDGIVRFGGAMTGSGDITKVGSGRLRLLRDNSAWQGTLIVEAGTVDVNHVNAVGGATGLARILGGEANVYAATASRFDVFGGTLAARAALTNVSLRGGDVRLHTAVPLDWMNDDSTGGTISLPIDMSAPLALSFDGSSPDYRGFEVQGMASGASVVRTLSGSVSLSEPSPLPLVFTGQDAELRVSGDLLSTNHIQDVRVGSGRVLLSGHNTFAGQTVVSSGNTLVVGSANALGTHDQGDADATIVESRSEIVLNAPSQERIILRGGTIQGTVRSTVVLEQTSTASHGAYSGTLTGPGGVIFTNPSTTGSSLQLNSANSYEGPTLLAGPSNRFYQPYIDVNHPGAFQNSAGPVEVASGKIRLNTSTGATYHVSGGQLLVSDIAIDDPVILDGGTLAITAPSIATPITVRRRGATLVQTPTGQVGGDPPEIHGAIGGVGDLAVENAVIVNSRVELQGDLVAYDEITFSETSHFSGGLVLDRRRGQTAAGTVKFWSDATVDLTLIQGGVETRGEATLFTGDATMEVHAGFLGAKLAGNGSLTKLSPGEAQLTDLGGYDGAVIVRQGAVRALGPNAFGSPRQGVVIDASQDASVSIEHNGPMAEPFVLRDATGFDRRGGLVFQRDVFLSGAITLEGSESIIASNGSPPTLLGGMGGTGGVIFTGSSTIHLRDAAHTHTGPTTIGLGSDGITVTMNDLATLDATSEIRIRSGATLRLEQYSVGRRNMVGDDIPLHLQGGTLEFVVSGSTPHDPSSPVPEDLGPLYLHSYGSTISLFTPPRNYGVLAFDSLNRAFQATLRVFSEINDEDFGGSEPHDQRLVFDQPVPIENGIIGGWAIAGMRETSRFRYDIATYDSEDGLVALGSRLGPRPDSFVGADVNQHVLLTSSPVTMEQDTRMGSLVVKATDNDPVDVDLGGSLLHVDSGGVVASRTNVNLHHGRLTAGSSRERTLYLHSATGRLTIAADIVDPPEGSMDVVVAGPNETYFSGHNHYSGRTYVQDGQLVIDAPESFPPFGSIEVTGNGDFLARTNIVAGDVVLRSGSISHVTGEDFLLESGSLLDVGGDGTMVKRGPGRVQVNDFVDFTGDVLIREGAFQVTRGDNQRGVITVEPQGTLELLENSYYVNLHRTVQLNGGTMWTSGGRTHDPVYLAAPVEVSEDGTVDVANKYFALNGGARLHNGSTLTKIGEGELRFQGPLVAGADTTIAITNGDLMIHGNLVAEHDDAHLTFRGSAEDFNVVSLHITSDNRTYDRDVTVEHVTLTLDHPRALGTGAVFLGDGAVLDVPGRRLEADLVLAGAALPAGAQLELVGSLTNARHIPANGDASPIHVDGDFAQLAAGSITFELADPAYGQNVYRTLNDRIEVTGKVTLDGTARLELLHDYRPIPGDSFDLLDFTALDGRFARLDLPLLQQGTVWDLSGLYATGEVAIAAIDALDVDFDQNGTADGADIDALLAQFGSEQPTFDLNRDGTVDHLDLDALLAGVFGTTLGDANLDRRVDDTDLAILELALFQSTSGWAMGDFNGDGSTDGQDFNIWNAHKGAAAGTSPVPESAAGAGLLVAALVCVAFGRVAGRSAA